MRFPVTGGVTFAVAVFALAFASSVRTQNAGVLDPAAVRQAALASGLFSLGSVPTPDVQNLGEFLKPGAAARQAAVRLGKAFFWDMQAGSDGQACASCHFHAGADTRTRNQLSPGLRGVPEDTEFGNSLLGGVEMPQFQPDYTLLPSNFPFHQLRDSEENNFNNRVVLRDTNDVASSMGVFAASFTGLVIGQPTDEGTAFADPVFNKDTPSSFDVGKNVRRVEPRNTPTVINAVFTHSNFWDGRAHNLFNGVSVIGPLDPSARIWEVASDGSLVRERVRIPNSSLASQAVGPPTSNLEMSFFDRPFPMVGRKLLGLTPLGLQVVDPTDGVLGPLSNFPNRGLNTSYSSLIRAAFQEKYWNSSSLTPDGLTLMEANFTLFWGLAVQLYETDLVSDHTPFDAFMEGNDSALTGEQLQGLLVFLSRGTRGNVAEVDAAIAAAEGALGVKIGAGNCVSCHGGPEFTDAAFTGLTEAPGELELIEIEDTTVLTKGLLAVSTVQGLLDNGFSNIGVRPTNDDLGRGGLENGFPLSFVRQMYYYLDLLEGTIEKRDFPCKVGRDCPSQLMVDGAFKIPGLRNVELTGPYFHNGGQATLSQVVEFYDRQSDFGDVNVAKLDRNMAFIELDEVDEEPLVAFLLALTDQRVRQEQAPFDHPQLLVPDGGTLDHQQPPIEVPRVGAGGRPAAGLPPLGGFLGLAP